MFWKFTTISKQKVRSHIYQIHPNTHFNMFNQFSIHDNFPSLEPPWTGLARQLHQLRGSAAAAASSGAGGVAAGRAAQVPQAQLEVRFQLHGVQALRENARRC
jgi:hypothetical protein